jgi:hypothetical protein
LSETEGWKELIPEEYTENFPDFQFSVDGGDPCRFPTATKDFGTSVEVPSELVDNYAFRNCPNDLLHDLPILEQQESRDTPNPVPHCDSGVGVDIELADFQLSIILGGNLFHDRGDDPTWAAPDRPKVNQNG